ncbi:MAG: VWA domain-containing protein [Planctomycetota bacterium]
MAALVLCLLLCSSTPIFAQADWSAKVLAQKDVDQKEVIVCVSGNNGVSTKTLAKLIARERHGPAVVSAAGQYFEKAEFDKETPQVIRQIAKRPDIGSQALAYAALSPKAADLILGFASSKSSADQQIAARMLAATSAMRLNSERPGQHPAEKVAGAPNNRLHVNYKVQVEHLLKNTKDKVTLEYLLLSVGTDRLVAVADAIGPHAKNKEQAVALAAQYALAGTGQPIDEELVLKAIARQPKRAKAKPALSYDLRQTPRLYAIRAAGEARLKSAYNPLLKLVTDQDLHTAVYSTRALSRIGGEGLPIKLIEAMDEETPWPVRVAIYNAAGFNPDKTAVKLLRQRYNEETGRFRQDALYALLCIVAGQPDGLTIEAFDEWWALNGEGFEVDVKASRQWRGQNKIWKVQIAPIAGFYESAVISDRPVFSVDASKSMEGAQIESLKQTLNEVVDSFPTRVKFNIVDFGGHCRTLAPGGMIPAKNRKAAMQQFTYDMELTFGTRTYDAIERAMDIPGMDTVHFLSDGSPYGSHIKNWSRIEYATRLYCSTAPVAVHIIYFPNPGQKVNAGGITALMKRYAHANAGNFHVIQVQAPNN